jgi:vanillate/3-O-methylgallate O-demethylase
MQLITMDREVKSLEDLLSSKASLFDYFYNDTLAPHSRARPWLSPIPLEHSNWVEEQRAWRETVVMFDQSHHMPEIFLKGAEAGKLLNYIGINSFAGFVPGRVKQFIGCNPHGQVIGECILYYLEDGSFELVSGMPLLNWVQYNAHKGGYEVTLERDNQTSGNPAGKRVKFRYGLDGPNAAQLFKEVVEGEVPQIPFFRTAKVRIAGCEVLAFRHGMAGHQGVELSGAFEEGGKVRAALLEAGKKHGLKPGGLLAYFSTIAEVGWVGSPFPAIFTSPQLKEYREWLPASGWEANAQLGGSFICENIEEYYVTPWHLGAEKQIKFDHEFIGRAALEQMAKRPPRVKRMLVWKKQDVLKVMGSMLEPGLAYKLIRLPIATYAYQQHDAIRTPEGKHVGTATFAGYTANEDVMLSLGLLDPAYGEIGTELVLTWGEPNGGSRKPHVERHRQTEINVTVAPAPYAETVRRIKHGTVA